MKLNLTLTAIAIGFSLAASATELPITCQNSNYKFQNDQLLLSTQTKTQQLYLLHNRSTQTILINHQKIPAGASAGWMSELAPQHWSAITVNQKNFTLTCSPSQPGNTVNKSCQQLLTVCFVPNAVFPKNLQNSAFWITENQTAKKIIAAIKQRKIKIAN
jgi:hypothetical protein